MHETVGWVGGGVEVKGGEEVGGGEVVFENVF